jgi:GNAT superfamily N-acetyltransferase
VRDPADADSPDRAQPTTLRDGSAVVIRPIAAEDDVELASSERFSERSLYLRFLGSPPKLTRATLAYLTNVDHHRHEALVAMAHDEDELVGVARFVCLAETPDTAEAAIIVADDWQQRGLGRKLLERLSSRAREEGIARFEASLLPENDAILALLRDLGDCDIDRSSANVVTVTITLSGDRAGGPGLLRTLRAAAAGQLRLPGADWEKKLKEIRAAWRPR